MEEAKKITKGESIGYTFLISIIGAIFFGFSGLIFSFILCVIFFGYKIEKKIQLKQIAGSGLIKLVSLSIFLGVIIYSSLFLGLLNREFIYPGISVFVAELVFLTSAWFMLSENRKKRSITQCFLALFGVIISLWFAVFTQLFFALSFAILLCLINGQYLQALKDSEYRMSMQSFGTYFSGIFGLFLSGAYIGNAGRVVIESSKKSNPFSLIKFVGPFIVLGLLISLIIPLLASADSVFKELIYKYLGYLSLDLSFLIDLGVIFGLALFIFTYFLYEYSREAHRGIIAGGTHKKYYNFRIPKLYTYIVLGGILSIYVLFVAVQFRYMFFGTHDMFQQLGLRYADYVHQGFYQLILIALINIVLLHVFSGGVSEYKKSARASKTIYLGLVLVTLCIIYSAFSRITLYIDAYHLTVLRFFVVYGISLLFITYVYLFVSHFHYFKQGTFVLAFSFVLSFVALGYINVDRQVAKYNINVAQNIQDIDGMYILKNLSRDALGEQARYLEKLKVFHGEEEWLNMIKAGKIYLADSQSTAIYKHSIEGYPKNNSLSIFYYNYYNWKTLSGN